MRIIGADLIHKNGLITDLRQGKITDPETGCQALGIFAQASINSIIFIVIDSKYTNLLKQFLELIESLSNHISIKNSVRHQVTTTSPPCAQRVRPLRPEILKQA